MTETSKAQIAADKAKAMRESALAFFLYFAPVLFVVWMMLSDVATRTQMAALENRMNLMGSRVSQNTTELLDHERRIGQQERNH